MERSTVSVVGLGLIAFALPVIGSLVIALFVPQFALLAPIQQRALEISIVAFGTVCGILAILYSRISMRQQVDELLQSLTGRDNYCWFEADLGQLVQSNPGSRANQLFIIAQDFVPNPNCYVCEAETGGDYRHSRYYHDKKHRHHERPIVRPGRFKSDIVIIPGPYIIQITTQFAQYEQTLRFGWWRGQPFQVWEIYRGTDRAKPLKKSERPDDFRDVDMVFE